MRRLGIAIVRTGSTAAQTPAVEVVDGDGRTFRVYDAVRRPARWHRMLRTALEAATVVAGDRDSPSSALQLTAGGTPAVLSDDGPAIVRPSTEMDLGVLAWDVLQHAAGGADYVEVIMNGADRAVAVWAPAADLDAALWSAVEQLDAAAASPHRVGFQMVGAAAVPLDERRGGSPAGVRLPKGSPRQHEIVPESLFTERVDPTVEMYGWPDGAGDQYIYGPALGLSGVKLAQWHAGEPAVGTWF